MSPKKRRIFTDEQKAEATCIALASNKSIGQVRNGSHPKRLAQLGQAISNKLKASSKSYFDHRRTLRTAASAL
jgi:hypothetical protein